MRDEPPSEEIPAEVLARYAAGECDRSERARVEAWAAGSAARGAYIAALQRSWARGRAGATDSELRETDEAWSALRARLGDIEITRDDRISGRPGGAPPTTHTAHTAHTGRAARPPAIHFFPSAARSTAWRTTLRTAAAVMIVAAGASGVVYLARRPAAPDTVAEHQAPMREVVTGTGERARIRLGDGSTVVLGARSRLGIPADFGERTRELDAEGEAYFNVAHDSTRPFIVHAGGTRTVDLGTAFVVRAYPEDSHVKVVVTEGSVALGADTPGAAALPTTVLRRGQMGRLDAGAKLPTVTRVDPAAYTSWMDGRLSFDNAPLPEVIAELGRWHGARIVLGDSSLAGETVTASLAADSFGEALRTLTTVLALRAEREGSTVVLHRRRGARR